MRATYVLRTLNHLDLRSDRSDRVPGIDNLVRAARPFDERSKADDQCIDGDMTLHLLDCDHLALVSGTPDAVLDHCCC